jgi:hypothetical protein
MRAYGFTSENGWCQDNTVTAVTPVTAVTDATPGDSLPHPLWTPQLVATDCQQPFHEEREDGRAPWRDETDLRVRSRPGDEPADWDLVPVDFDAEMPAWLYCEDERSWAEMAEFAG